MIRAVPGALAFITLPGLVAVAVGFILAGVGVVALVVGLGCLVACRWRSGLRAVGAGVAAGGVVLGLAGAGLAVFGEEASDGSVADAGSPIVALVAVAVAFFVGRYVARAVDPRARESSR